METLRLLTSNYLINVAFLSWFLAQVIKTALNAFANRKFNAERLVGAGGMPSSHSALVCALAIGTCRKMGYSSPEFALALAFAAVVMYDAMGVRRAAGEQAKVLNKLVFGFPDLWDFINSYATAIKNREEPPHFHFPPLTNDEPEEDDADENTFGDKALKEVLGHTPLEVLAGALLGILVAMMVQVS